MFSSLSTTTVLLLACGAEIAWAFSLPQNGASSLLRAAGIKVTRAGFTYGPAVAGGPLYPAGVLGLAKNAVDVAAAGIETAAQAGLTVQDQANAAASVQNVRRPHYKHRHHEITTDHERKEQIRHC